VNWDALGAIAELLGSVAVVVTLLFLLKQLKTNSVMIQNSTAQGAADAIASWQRQKHLLDINFQREIETKFNEHDSNS
jgi:hypothetical protein